MRYFNNNKVEDKDKIPDLKIVKDILFVQYKDEIIKYYN